MGSEPDASRALPGWIPGLDVAHWPCCIACCCSTAPVFRKNKESSLWGKSPFDNELKVRICVHLVQAGGCQMMAALLVSKKTPCSQPWGSSSSLWRVQRGLETTCPARSKGQVECEFRVIWDQNHPCQRPQGSITSRWRSEGNPGPPAGSALPQAGQVPA